MVANPPLWADIAKDLDAALAQATAAVTYRGHGDTAEVRGDTVIAAAIRLGVGRCVDAAFSAVEAALERLLVEVDGNVPAGPRHHAELLRRAVIPIPTLRAAVLPGEVFRDLDALRGFRHAYRHVYEGFEYELAAPNVDLAARCIPRAAAEIERFCRDFGITPPELPVRFPG